MVWGGVPNFCVRRQVCPFADGGRLEGGQRGYNLRVRRILHWSPMMEVWWCENGSVTSVFGDGYVVRRLWRFGGRIEGLYLPSSASGWWCRR